MRSIGCHFTQKRLDAFHDGELESSARAKTEAHLARCSACAGELAALGRLRAALAIPLAEPPDAVWETFWPQVRARIAADPVEQTPPFRGSWLPSLGPWRLALGTALAGAVAVLLVAAPWQREPEQRIATQPIAMQPIETPRAGLLTQAAVVESVETGDPQSSVMVYTNPESETTVVWVFGLDSTEF